MAAEILKFIAPRILYAWEHPDVPVKQVMADVDVVFHHPALRNERVECHRTMFKVVQDWARGSKRNLDQVLSSESVKEGKNHKVGVKDHNMVDHHTMNQQQMQNAASGGHAGGIMGMLGGGGGSGGQQHGGGGHQQQSSSPFGMVGDLVGKVTGQQQQQQHGSGGGGGHSSSGFGGFGGGGHSSGGGHGGGNQSGGLGDMLHMAEKLPGVGGYASKINKFTGGGGGHSSGGGGLSSFLGGGGGRRGLDGDEPDSATRGGIDPQAVGGAGQATLGAYAAEGGQYGGGAEQQHSRSPSPMPLAPPEGYESYTRSGMEYDGQTAAPAAYGEVGASAGYYQQGGGQQGYDYGQQQGGYQQGYDQGYGGGASSGYYR